jgi:hypothetical protein
LFDAYHVPKPLPQQLLPFGRSSDGLEVLTFGVEQVLVLSVPCGRSARAQCSLCVLRVLAHLCFRSVVFLSFSWVRFRTVRVYQADSLRVPGGQSACSPRPVHYSGCDSIGSESFFGQSACGGRTVRTGFCSSELVLRFLFVSFRFLSLGFLVVPFRLFEPFLGSCLCVWVRGVAIGV